MAPTARAAFEFPALIATCLYVINPPLGIFLTMASTFLQKVFIHTVYQNNEARCEVGSQNNRNNRDSHHFSRQSAARSERTKHCNFRKMHSSLIFWKIAHHCRRIFKRSRGKIWRWNSARIIHAPKIGHDARFLVAKPFVYTTIAANSSPITFLHAVIPTT